MNDIGAWEILRRKDQADWSNWERLPDNIQLASSELSIKLVKVFL